MLTEQFLNLACTCSTFDSPLFTSSIAKTIAEILEFYSSDSEEIPMQFSQKFELAKTLCELKSAAKSRDHILDNVKASGKFQELEPFINSLEMKTLTESECKDCLKHIDSRKKLLQTLKHYEEIRRWVEDFGTNNFASVDDAISAYGAVVTEMYSDYSQSRRSENITNIMSLNLMSDDYESVLNAIESNYSGKNAVPSGFSQLDENINGGHEPGRLYIYAGASNVGKSTLLLNFIRNTIERKNYQKEVGSLPELHALITLENYVDESLLRLYCSTTQQTTKEVVRNFDVERLKISKVLKSIQVENEQILDMTYFPAGSISVPDIIMHLEELKDQWQGKAELKSVYIDYLDLVKSGQKFDLHRLELGQVTVDLKVLAATLHIPVIVPTQLNRASYDDATIPTLAMMGESIKKVEHADFVGLLKYIHDKVPEGEELAPCGNLNVYIGKNRSGPKNKVINLRADFSHFRVDDHQRIGLVKIDEPVSTGNEAI